MANKIPQIGTNEFNDLASACFGGKPKKTTIELAEKEFEKIINKKLLPTKQLLEVAEHYFIIGYATGQERSYSEEDMINFVEFVSKYYSDDLMENSTIHELLEQFKNK